MNWSIKGNDMWCPKEVNGGPNTNSLNVLSWHCKLTYGWLDNPSCSAMASLSEWIFKSSCLIHDMCYMSEGWTQSECDSQFHWNMLQQCREEYPNRLVIFACHK